MKNLLCGIDLGGTKIELVLLNAENNFSPIERCRIPTEASKGYQHILNQISSIITRTEQKHKLIIERVGIGTPGALDPGSLLMKNSNTTCLNGMPFKTDIETLCHKEFVFANDANCFAVAETIMGVVPDHLEKPEVVFGVIMGTGVGGGIILKGKVHPGVHHIGGEWGHNYLDASGGNCYCGKSGCVEQIISGPALERYYKKISGNEKHLKDIIEIARADADQYAVQTMDRLIHFFGISISALINILDPDAIILGGGLGNIDELYSKGVESVAKHVFNPELRTKFLKPRLGDSAGVFGAALLLSGGSD